MLLIAIGMLWWGHAAPAAAQTCTASASTMAFGTIYTPNNSIVTTTSTINVSCSGDGSAKTVRICPYVGGGDYGRSVGGPRRLGSDQARLDFDVFTDGSYASRYPNDTTDGTTPSITLDVPASGAANASVTLYGRIPANQTIAPVGSYSAVLISGVYYGPAATYTDCANGGRGQLDASISVSATNAPICTSSTSPVVFGSVNGLSQAVDATGAIGVTCSNGASYTIGLDGGANGGTGATTRMLANGTDRISYGLYHDNERSQGWYTDAGSVATGTGNGTMQSILVYGRVPVQASPRPGSYSDTVTATITY